VPESGRSNEPSRKANVSRSTSPIHTPIFSALNNFSFQKVSSAFFLSVVRKCGRKKEADGRWCMSRRPVRFLPAALPPPASGVDEKRNGPFSETRSVRCATSSPEPRDVRLSLPTNTIFGETESFSSLLSFLSSQGTRERPSSSDST
jgi:hypothetical protein